MLVIRLVFVAVLVGLLTGCVAGSLNYDPPNPPSAINNSKVVTKSRDAVWNAAVPSLGKQFFVINNLDKASGLINISYSGDPEKYVDCGSIRSEVENARGKRSYFIPGAKADANYEYVADNSLFLIHRQVNVDGRMNLVFEELSPNETRVTANTRYVVSRSM